MHDEHRRNGSRPHWLLPILTLSANRIVPSRELDAVLDFPLEQARDSDGWQNLALLIFAGVIRSDGNLLLAARRKLLENSAEYWRGGDSSEKLAVMALLHQALPLEDPKNSPVLLLAEELLPSAASREGSSWFQSRTAFSYVLSLLAALTGSSATLEIFRRELDGMKLPQLDSDRKLIAVPADAIEQGIFLLKLGQTSREEQFHELAYHLALAIQDSASESVSQHCKLLNFLTSASASFKEALPWNTVEECTQKLIPRLEQPAVSEEVLLHGCYEVLRAKCRASIPDVMTLSLF